MSHYLAIDVGTEGARVAIYADDGECVGEGVSGYPTSFPRPGWAEQDPERWWSSVVEATRAAIVVAGVSKFDGVSVATTASSVVVLDAAGRPLRPALLWMDSRASSQADRTAELQHEALIFSGGTDSSEWLVPKAMWISENEPDIYDEARYIGESVDYLTWKLTDQWLGSRLNATCKWNYDSRTGALPHELYGLLGVPDLGDKLASDIRAVGSVAGRVSASAASELGLSSRPLVAVGGIDAHLTLVPLRAISTHPVSVVAGTSNAFVAELADPVFSSELWGPYPGALTEGLWLVEGGQVSAGSALTWLAERVLGFSRKTASSLIADAAAVPGFSDGLLVLDNFMGNRTPLRDPRLRGAVLGATIATTKAQLYRATVESVAFGTRQVLESFDNAGVDTSEVFFSGGIRHNPLWLQTTAEVLGRPINLVLNENLTLRACAATAAVASGGYRDLDDAAVAFSPEIQVIDPVTSAVGSYDEIFALYQEATSVTADIHHRLYQMAVDASPVYSETKS